MQKTLVKVPIVLWTERPWPSRSNLTWKSKFTPFWACPHHNSLPIEARITKFGPAVQNTLVQIPIVFWGAIDLDLQCQIWLKKSKFQVLPYWKYTTTIKPPESHEYLDCFKGLTVSRSPSSACAHMPRLFHGPDCFTVSTCCTYIDLGSRACFGVNAALVLGSGHFVWPSFLFWIHRIWWGCG